MTPENTPFIANLTHFSLDFSPDDAPEVVSFLNPDKLHMLGFDLEDVDPEQMEAMLQKKPMKNVRHLRVRHCPDKIEYRFTQLAAVIVKCFDGLEELQLSGLRGVYVSDLRFKCAYAKTKNCFEMQL